MPAYAVHAPHLAPSGAAYVVALDLTTFDGASFRGARLAHLVTARDDCVSVYEVRQKEHDEAYFVLLRRHRAFGVCTGLSKVQLDATADDDDGRDRLLVSFKDAKMALMEWSDALADLQTVSIHTYERAPQLSNAPPPNFLHHLTMDPVSRCAALLLPHDALAVLPFFQDAAELEMLDALEDEGNVQLERSLPYSPSFLLPLADIDARIRNVKDVIFLPDFQRPTMAVLFSRDQTWTGRLNERRDVFSLYLITLDLSVSSQHAIISTRDMLPYNALYLAACPAHLSGGVLLITTTSILHVDQGGRIVGVALSAWHGAVSNVALPLLTLQGHEKGLDLGNSHVVFACDAGAGARSNQAILFLADGSTFALTLHLDGRTIASLELAPLDSGTKRRATPSLALPMLKAGMVFTGSLLGDATLWRLGSRTKLLLDADGGKKEEEMDLDLDEDLYGDSLAPDTAPGGRALTELYLAPCAALLGLGPVLDLKPCVLHQPWSTAGAGGAPASGGGQEVLQSVACTGAAPTGGLAFFEPRLVSRKRRRVAHAEAPRGVWALSPSSGAQGQGRTLALTSAEQESCLCAVDAEGAMERIATLPEPTVAAAPLPGAGAQGLWARATPRGISVVDAQGDVLQPPTISAQGEAAQEEEEEVYQAHIVGPYSVLVLADASLALHAYAPSARAFRHIPFPAERQKRYTAASLFCDAQGFFPATDAAAGKERQERERRKREEKENKEREEVRRERERRERMMLDDEVDYEADDAEMGEEHKTDANGNGARNGTSNAYANAALQQRSEEHEEEGKTWLVLLRNDGCIEIRDVQQPTLPPVWQSNSLAPAPLALAHVPEGAEEVEEGMYVARACLALVGDVPHLVVTYETGLLVVYEAIPSAPSSSSSSTSPTPTLALTMHKTYARQLASSSPSSSSSAPLANGDADAVVATSLTPFRAWAGLSGVFVGGEKAGWLVRTLTGPLGFVESAEKGVDAFAPLPGCGTEERGFLFSQFGVVFSAALPALSFDLDVPHRHVATGRTYTKVTAHAMTRTVVAASESPMQFQLFDPEDQTVVQDPSVDPSPAYFARGSLELFTEDGGEPVDGFEFEPYETVCAIEGVTLSSVSTLEGTRDYIAVGTITAHGEDRPARGNVYIFDVVEVVPHPGDPGAKFRLRLVCKDDCKAPITTIADINGFLVVTMGQKLFVRSLENDEWLVTIAFLDIPYQSTMLRRLKNYLLLSDVAKATWLIAFQESPYKLTVVAKDFIDLSCSTGDYLINGDQMAIITTAVDKVVRLLDYAPTVPASQGGLKLMLRTEYRIASEPSSSLMVPGASDGGFSQQSEIVYALHNGAIETVVPVDEDVFARLQVLQSQMVRNVQHFAGLNPRGYRAVRNELFSRPQTKGILDGLLLSSFERLPRPKMDELVSLLQGAMGDAGADQVLRDLASLRTHWGQVE